MQVEATNTKHLLCDGHCVEFVTQGGGVFTPAQGAKAGQGDLSRIEARI